MSNRTCSLPDCESPHLALGYCVLHYGRSKRGGDLRKSMKGKAHKVVYTSDGLRVCKACGVAKPESEYHKDKGGSDGLRAQCKPCRNGYMAGYYEENREAKVDYERSRRLNNGDHMRAWDRARYESQREKRIAIAEQYGHVRRARLANVESEPGVTVKRLRKDLGDGCCYCGVLMDFVPRKRGEGISPRRATLEHVIPISRGGTHTFDNASLACHSCNTSKNNKPLLEWLEWKAGDFSGGKEAPTPGSSGDGDRCSDATALVARSV